MPLFFTPENSKYIFANRANNQSTPTRELVNSTSYELELPTATHKQAASNSVAAVLRLCCGCVAALSRRILTNSHSHELELRTHTPNYIIKRMHLLGIYAYIA
jgi:hypothetical protein